MREFQNNKIVIELYSLLNTNDIKVLLIVLSIICEMKNNNYSIQKSIIYRLLCFYDETENDELKETVVKCLSLFIDTGTVYILKYLSKNEIFYKLLNHTDYLSENQVNMIISSIKECTYDKKNEQLSMNNIIKNNY